MGQAVMRQLFWAGIKNGTIWVDWTIERMYYVNERRPNQDLFGSGSVAMDRKQIGLKLTIDALGLPFKISSFEDRLILQKAVYLAQAGGVNLGYFYHWYLYGPYSSSLTRDAYAIECEVREGLDESKGWELDKGSQTKLERLKGLMTGGSTSDKRQQLELLGSVHFLVDRKQVRPNDVEGITATLKRFKKDFSKEKVEAALGDLTKHGLFAE